MNEDEFMRRARASQTPENAAKYERCIEAMNAAAGAWFRAHPFAEPRFRTAAFEEDMIRKAGRKPGERIAIAAALVDAIDRWADNEDAKALLRAMDAAADAHGGGTYMQAKAILSAALERAVGSAQLPEGDWRCTGCEKMNDGFTTTRRSDGTLETPPPGAIGVCWYCADFNRVNAAGNGYERVTDADIRALPKAVRTTVLAMRNEQRRRIEQERKRS